MQTSDAGTNCDSIDWAYTHIIDLRTLFDIIRELVPQCDGDQIYEVAIDVPMLRLQKCQRVKFIEQQAFDCDCLYLFATGEIMTLQWLGRGIYRMVDSGGKNSRITQGELDSAGISARIVRCY